MSDSGVVLSVDPGQKGGPTNSYSVVQAWLPAAAITCCWSSGASKRASGPAGSHAQNDRRYNASAVLIEETNQGPPLLSEIRPRPGMRVYPIMPIGDKIERVPSTKASSAAGASNCPRTRCGARPSLPNGRSSPARVTMIRSMLQCNTWSGSRTIPPRPSGRGPGSSACSIRADNKYNGRGVFRTRRAGAACWHSTVAGAGTGSSQLPSPGKSPGRIRPGLSSRLGNAFPMWFGCLPKLTLVEFDGPSGPTARPLRNTSETLKQANYFHGHSVRVAAADGVPPRPRLARCTPEGGEADRCHGIGPLVRNWQNGSLGTVAPDSQYLR